MAVAALNSRSSSRDMVAPDDNCDQGFRMTSSLHKNAVQIASRRTDAVSAFTGLWLFKSGMS
jgi:hypothetical protein